MNNDDLLNRLHRSNPVPDDAVWQSDAQQQRLYMRIVSSAYDGRQRRLRTRRPSLRLSLVLAVIAALALSGATVGQRGNLMGLFMLDTEDIPAEITETQRITPLPPGAAWDPIDYETEGVVYEKGVFVTIVQSQAACKWYAYWQDARARDDAAAESVAMATIREIPNWKMSVENTAPESREWFAGVVARADAGNTTDLDQVIEANCRSTTMKVEGAGD